MSNISWIFLGQQFNRLTVKSMARARTDKTQQTFYAVQKGLRTGVFSSWNEVKPLVEGFAGAVQKKFTNRAAAEAFVRGNGYGGERPSSSSRITKPSVKVAKPGVRSSKLSKLPDESIPTFRIGGIRLLGPADAPIPVYTDGASRNNQSSNAKAGYGVYFGPGHSDNVSKPLAGMPQTNQRAELTAIYEACKIIRDRNDGHFYDIRTDSQYSISSVTQWGLKWKTNGWKSSTGDVKNKDIIEPIMDLLELLGSRVRFTKVKGHSGDPGNDAADVLAVKGADM